MAVYSNGNESEDKTIEKSRATYALATFFTCFPTSRCLCKHGVQRMRILINVYLELRSS